MGALGNNTLERHHPLLGYLVGTAALALAAGAGMAGCGDNGEASSGAGGGENGGGVANGGHTSTGTASGGGSNGGGGAGGGAPKACTTTAKGSTRGSAVALTPNDKRLVTVNRDVGSITVMSITYDKGGQPTMKPVKELHVGNEPWQVAIDGCGTTAYVVLRKDQKVVEIDDIDGTPKVGRSVAVGSEPTSLALTPNNTALYVSNWVDGTLSVIDPLKMKITGTVDLNKTLADTGLLGTGVTPRAAMAHPRGITISNNGNKKDTDETVYVTEWFAQRTAPEFIATADTNWKGLLYQVGVGNTSATTIDLPAVDDTGFHDHTGGTTGCFPNQVASVTLDDAGFAYVTSTCASPKGPLGVFTGKATGAAGLCAGATDPGCGTDGAGNNFACTNVAAVGTCTPNPTDVKTTTHPAVTIVDLSKGSGTTNVLDQLFVAKTSARLPLLPTDIAFFNGFAYVSSEGADAVFRLVVGAGAITDVGVAGKPFIDMRKPPDTSTTPPTPDTLIRLPIGIATNHGSQAFAFVANEGSRDITAVDFNSQFIAGDGSTDFRIESSSALPTSGSAEDNTLQGKRLFNTGLGRWSLNGAAWGSCGACHVDGLSDNVTWYFNRGPRQTVSLDGTFASKDPSDQRILNWTGIFDEIADFEGNVRNVSGGVGAIVSVKSTPPVTTDRINTATEVPPQQGLQGSSTDAVDGSSAHPHSILPDWVNIELWIQSIRSPRRPTNLVQSDVDKGREIFKDTSQGNCIACHSGPKWTISKRFYTPGDGPNDITGCSNAACLEQKNWFLGSGATSIVNGFPASLFPVTDTANAHMRLGAPAPGGTATEQIQCVLRPVGTIAKDGGGNVIGVSDTTIGVLELRQDMVSPGQGTEDNGRGFNPPSLLGMGVGAPYFHAGNARTLEEVFNARFAAHHGSEVASVFNPAANPTTLKRIVAYVLSIDEDEKPIDVPTLGTKGGDLCFYP